MSTFKKFCLGLGAVLTPGLLLAQESGGDDTSISDAITSLQGTVVDMLGDVGAAVLVIVGAGVVIWAIPFAWRKLRGGAGR